MTASPPGAYGAASLPIWRADVRDQLRGARHRAYARHGLLTPPAGSGRLIWVKSAASRESVMLGAELVRAIRTQRQDVRLALTFEEEYPELVRPRLQGIARAGVGFGPAAHPRILDRVLRRFDPLGVVLVRDPQAAALVARVAMRHIPALVVNAPAPGGLCAARVYPSGPAQAAAWAGQGAEVAPPADFLTLLTEAQVDPNFRSAIHGGDGYLWWFEAAPGQALPALVAAWQAQEGRGMDLLFVGDGSPGWARRATPPGWVRLSTWDRARVPGGSVVLVDEYRWLPALATSVDAIYLATHSDSAFWQALAGGCPVDAPADVARRHPDLEALDVVAPEAVTGRWRDYAADPIGSRRRGDALRRYFWQQRRQAADAATALLGEVHRW